MAEVLIVMVVISILAFLGPINFLQSKKLARENVMHNSARTAVRSYIEQINGVQYDTLQEVMADPASVQLPIKNVSSLRTNGDIEISDGLFLNTVNNTIIPLDTQNIAGGKYDNLTMDLFVTPSVEKFIDPDGTEVLEFTLKYHFESSFKGLTETHKGVVSFNKPSVSEL